MSRSNSAKFNHRIVEWERKSENVAAFKPWPEEILFEYIASQNPLDIISRFWHGKTEEIHILDLSALTQYWHFDTAIIAARVSIEQRDARGNHTFVFDKPHQRLVISATQDDWDGNHGKVMKGVNHVHIKIGSINEAFPCRLGDRTYRKRDHVRINATLVHHRLEDCQFIEYGGCTLG